MDIDHYARQAIALARTNMEQGGGPFGALIVRDGEVIATGANRVTATHDPTAHAEVVAIRRACAELKVFHLEGCDIYSSCEPCPMCLSAIYWAKVDRVYYCATRVDAADAGFADDHIYREIPLEPARRSKAMKQILRHEALTVFDAWRSKDDKVPY
ncbi:MAG: nucleoside deaminase [Myxococcota bacterium]|nr:nucleoside deaminase [Myxococcota bacterium]